ncbi:ATP-binding cassette domain-containing protein [Sphingomonas sp.]|uniref:ATP-binding cassette domain-containing protein n=1 Tax=Sphingomonas sp. TaxID=28214 RepID=UPI001D6BF7CC|nr:ATP-binding cassette domain-containing protein [Sphingomonas sp.]MBX9797082.1 ATP-binding cassette domain-containing protein [Sphingomonas sp.]
MSVDPLIVPPKPRFAAWLMAPMRRNSSVYAKVVIAAVLINVFGFIASIFSMVVYDRVIPHNAINSLIGLSIGLGVVVLFDFALKLLRAYFVDVAGADIDQQVGETVFQRIIAMRMELRKGSTGALAGMMRELEVLREFFASVTMVAIVDVPFIIVTLIVIAAIGGWLVLVPALLVPLVILAGFLTQPAMDRLSSDTMREGLAKQSVLVEAIGAIETVKAAGAAPMLSGRWRQALNAQSGLALRRRLIGSIATTFAGSAGTLAYSGVVILGAVLMGYGYLTVGALTACSILSSRAISPLGQIALLASRLSATRTAYAQISALMEQPVEGPAGQGLSFATLTGAVELRGVSFRYPGAAEPVLRDVSLKVAPGERVALLGKVGSGKSTLARLILGLYPPEEGVAMLDGTDIRQLDPVFRNSMGAALQESVLFTGTIRENITLGRPGIDDAEMLRVAQLAGVHEFVGRIANGYDLRLADRGEGLSGGQRQSIALARALAGRPQLLVLDEPTSAMDNHTELALIQRLAEEVQGRTLILITHRPQLLALANRVIVFDQGRIAADGPRDQILRSNIQTRAA